MLNTSTTIHLPVIHRHSIFPPYNYSKEESIQKPMFAADNALLFLVNVSMGNPSSHLLAMDTGSNLVWIHAGEDKHRGKALSIKGDEFEFNVVVDPDEVELELVRLDAQRLPPTLLPPAWIQTRLLPVSMARRFVWRENGVAVDEGEMNGGGRVSSDGQSDIKTTRR
ncbi:eukaryotic aspartyl protease family protein [Striga asiatica]|uniref:Eukaryotic aspartyl protease family protein n=1 Tax=Striga asiatica TaxID=4170 RepID=A0A5A7R3T9_STRAF|nr:eukaryotic aspartyl protease family protein [Striga asiatica]